MPGTVPSVAHLSTVRSNPRQGCLQLSGCRRMQADPQQAPACPILYLPSGLLFSRLLCFPPGFAPLLIMTGALPFDCWGLGLTHFYQKKQYKQDEKVLETFFVLAVIFKPGRAQWWQLWDAQMDHGFSWTGELWGFGAALHRAGILNMEIHRPLAWHSGTGAPFPACTQEELPAHKTVQTSPKAVGHSGVWRAITRAPWACLDCCWHAGSMFRQGWHGHASACSSSCLHGWWAGAGAEQASNAMLWCQEPCSAMWLGTRGHYPALTAVTGFLAVAGAMPLEMLNDIQWAGWDPHLLLQLGRHRYTRKHLRSFSFSAVSTITLKTTSSFAFLVQACRGIFTKHSILVYVSIIYTQTGIYYQTDSIFPGMESAHTTKVLLNSFPLSLLIVLFLEGKKWPRDFSSDLYGEHSNTWPAIN